MSSHSHISHEAPEPRLPRPLRFVVGIVRFEAWITALAGGYAVFIGLLSLMVSPRHWQFAAAASIVGAAALGFAAILFRVRRGLARLSERSRLQHVIVHALMLPPAIALFIASTSVVNQGGTDGPFADGGQGLVGLLGMSYLFISIATIVILLLGRSTRSAFATRSEVSGTRSANDSLHAAC